MTRRIFGSFGIKFEHCTRLPQQGGAVALIDLVQRVGGTFLRAGRPNPDPSREINNEGGIWPTDIAHELFPVGERPGLGFVQDGSFVSVGCDISYVDMRRVDAATRNSQTAPLYVDVQRVDAVATGFLRFAELVYPHLCPEYGWLDESGERLYREQDVPARKIAYLFWANFFGPPYVERYGRDFLLGAPGWRVEELSDGGILYVLSPSFVNLWQVAKEKEVLDYFRRKAPGIRPYRRVRDKVLE
ncbi:MAG: hypothetical protein EPO21_19615 [Chloroflexota bacterium]|nr:MAG: hypothetical protein EPO21_19615 [Chloroflexota bacterium]